MLHKESTEFIWESPEFEFKEKNKNWYWYVGIVGVALIVLAIIFHNYLLGFLILVGGFLMFSLATKEPLILPIEVSQHGIKVHDDMYAYTTISAFWIGENKRNEAILLFSSSRPIAPIISVVIEPSINIMELREYLLEFINEQELREPFTDKIIDKIGF
jgi:hypothetical protein